MIHSGKCTNPKDIAWRLHKVNTALTWGTEQLYCSWCPSPRPGLNHSCTVGPLGFLPRASCSGCSLASSMTVAHRGNSQLSLLHWVQLYKCAMVPLDAESLWCVEGMSTPSYWHFPGWIASLGPCCPALEAPASDFQVCYLFHLQWREVILKGIVFIVSAILAGVCAPAFLLWWANTSLALWKSPEGTFGDCSNYWILSDVFKHTPWEGSYKLDIII